ncbi:MAG: succinate dehydrogenase, hydrophobic membrane anchor protein [Gammaproteobacteria bacterium]|nr:succinate dehydrogenase, hydrophobic membrane anchor protein [Gammaproteobacteria bacterium]
MKKKNGFILKNAFYLSGGASDWLIQRITSLVLGSYVLTLLSFFLINQEISYQVWTNFFGTGFMRIFTVLAVVAASAHGWIGMWAIGGDYLQEHHFGPIAGPVRKSYLGLCALLAILYVVFVVLIVWGN